MKSPRVARGQAGDPLIPIRSAYRRTSRLSNDLFTSLVSLARLEDPRGFALVRGYALTPECIANIEAVRAVALGTVPIWLLYGVPISRLYGVSMSVWNTDPTTLISAERLADPDVQAAIADARRVGLHVAMLAYAYPMGTDRRVDIAVWGRVVGSGEHAYIDELDTIQRMGLLGALTRTPPHEDGYWWIVTRETVRFLSARQAVGAGEVS